MFFSKKKPCKICSFLPKNVRNCDRKSHTQKKPHARTPLIFSCKWENFLATVFCSEGLRLCCRFYFCDEWAHQNTRFCLMRFCLTRFCLTRFCHKTRLESLLDTLGCAFILKCDKYISDEITSQDDVHCSCQI